MDTKPRTHRRQQISRTRDTGTDPRLIERASIYPPGPPSPPAWGRWLIRLIRRNNIKQVNYIEYRQAVRDIYDGPRGAALALCSLVSLHSLFGERLFRTQRFDLRGIRNVLDVGSGAGQIAKHLLKYGEPDTRITCCDLSHRMLLRARNRLKSDRVQFVASDLTLLPFPDATFDCVTCGYVLEHLPDPFPGLRELSRVMTPGARMLLITTEDNFCGAWTSRFWNCRTYGRLELRRICEQAGLYWKQEFWFSSVHRAIRAGGICVEIVKEG